MAKDLFIDLLYVEKVTDDKRTENQFKELLKGFKKQYLNTTPKYEIDFKKAYSNRRKYYLKLIETEYIKNFNQINDALEINTTPGHLSFLYDKEYNRIKNYLNQISNYVSDNDLDETLYLKPIQNDKSDEAYIISFLKANAMMLFMELQERFSELSDAEIYTIEELHEVFFNEEPPQELIVKSYSGAEIKTVRKQVKQSSIFNAIQGDFREENNDVLSYNELINKIKQREFAKLEELLNEKGIIDDEYNFIKNRGNKILLAAFMVKLTETKYFNERIFFDRKPSKKIEPKHIYKFFAYRYGPSSNAGKEYRRFLGTEKRAYQKLVEANFWLDQIK
ncbi:hypothetical protein FHS04_002882 [Mesoflavibacter sabulilitoris]|uniref:Uncharacterized protein n=1 Tax=Mesoflavibacter zeaxanthinifaciens subsp. sabulilitoris TaxID=1520893 RepID=A0A2T1NNH7_9FLAO|nr:DUF6617 family protein [Mesoflavibacter zeaxanthinifaciens]MBB3125338.1 hypothetical protein [Mesoflavibacter zeaxanthinifaciens subsp. sabulilitoris]PSG94448.1 hypothetical protein C7H61_01090 [Mesoflavibacter zeaxanthinifaciens subsp. sabulilitoris]